MQFTVDSVKKQEFIIFLLMPETRVSHAMRKAEFTKEDIADLLLRRFLQRALPGACWRRAVGRRGGQLAVAALAVTVTMARGCHCPSTTKYRASTTKAAL